MAINQHSYSTDNKPKYRKYFKWNALTILRGTRSNLGTDIYFFIVHKVPNIEGTNRDRQGEGISLSELPQFATFT